jgi:hypothetical protein
MSTEPDPEAEQLIPELGTLSDLLEKSPEKFVTGCEDIPTAALTATKFVFDLGSFSLFPVSIYVSLIILQH